MESLENLRRHIDNRQWEQATKIFSSLLHVEIEELEVFQNELSSDHEILHTAIENDASSELITKLLYPTNINLQGRDGNSALHVLIKRKQWELVPVFIANGADLDLCNHEESTPLHLAAQTCNTPDIMEQLISSQNINMQNRKQCAALQLVLKRKEWDLVPILLQNGAHVDLSDKEDNTPLHDAVRAPVLIFKQLISPQNINMPNEDGMTPLRMAIKYKKWKIVTVLIEGGADINLYNELRETPLCLAVRFDAPLDIISKLIAPQNINNQDRDGRTALHVAVREKHWHHVELLIKNNADLDISDDFYLYPPLIWAIVVNAPAKIIKRLTTVRNVHRPDSEGCMPLHALVRGKNWALVQWFIQQHRADINSRDYSGKTPLHWAVSNSVQPFILSSWLLCQQNVNVQDNRGQTALHLALIEKEWNLVPIFIQNGADICLRDIRGCTPLHFGVSSSAPVNIITLLLCPENINIQDNKGYSALHFAMREIWNLIPVLIQNGADINLCDFSGKSSLHWAILNGAEAEIITQLICPENINIQDKKKATALHLALKQKEWNLVPILIQKGADINMCDCDGKTPLHWAVFNRAERDIITQLICAENIDIQDSFGSTALHLVRGIMWKLVPVFIQNGANITLCDDLGRTPLHYAIKCFQTDINHLICPQNINIQTKQGSTALHSAVKCKIWNIVRVLIQNGADINMCDNSGCTPLLMAVSNSAPEVIITELLSSQSINVQNKQGISTLYMGVMNKMWNLVPLFIEYGADINLCDIRKNSTSLICGVVNGAPRNIIKLLISSGNINMQEIPPKNRTALQAAVVQSRWELVPVLLQHGADVNLVGFSRKTPLHFAVEKGAPKPIVQQLVSPMNINMETLHGHTVLHLAVMTENWDLVQPLIQYGADPYKPDLLSEPPRPHTLQAMAASAIRSYMTNKSDEAYASLELPEVLLYELKFTVQATELIAIKK